MLDLPLDAAGRYAESNADERGIAKTPIPGLAVVRSTRPRDLETVAGRPSIGIVLQGAMNAADGGRSVAAVPGSTLLLDPAAPTMHFVASASLAEPFLAVMMEIDFALVADPSVDIDAAHSGTRASGVAETDDEVATAFHRLLALLRRPQSVFVLLEPLLRELHYWMLSGKHGRGWLR